MMKLRVSLFALMLAFPLLYLTGAVFQDGSTSTLALVFVAAVCGWLLKPEPKS
jgi:hypothetical protein